MPGGITVKHVIRNAIKTLKSADLPKGLWKETKKFWKATIKDAIRAADVETFEFINRFEQKHISSGERDRQITNEIGVLEAQRKKLATHDYKSNLIKTIEIATINEKLRLLGRVNRYYVKAKKPDLILRRETNRQYKSVRKLGVSADLARARLQKALADSIKQVVGFDAWLMRRKQDLITINASINHRLTELLEDKKTLSSPEAKNRLDNQLEIAKINIHIAGWNWLKSRWLPPRFYGTKS